MYFEMFPSMLYTLDNGVSAQVIQDILRRVQLSDELKSNGSFFDLYDVKDGETPEMVASRWYGNPQYHWIILLANEIIDPRFDWPMSQVNLIEYCKDKYTSSNIYLTHHYVDADGYEVNMNATGATPVSNFQYEDEINESKRRIKILKAEIVSELVSNFEVIVNR